MDKAVCRVGLALVLILSIGAPAQSPNGVSGSVSVVSAKGGQAPAGANAHAVVWLRPAAAPAIGPLKRERFKIIQQRKRFEPRVLAVPVGSVVEFPNLDPFFHNVFSLFDGKRFDLGLYEAGSTHAVTFDRPGVSYIFCNIHPEMSAIVLSLDTPYYALTNRAGEFIIPNVPPGRYILNVWHERGKPESRDVYSRPIEVAAAGSSIPPVRLVDSGRVSIPHKNKYGREYDPPPTNGLYK